MIDFTSRITRTLRLAIVLFASTFMFSNVQAGACDITFDIDGDCLGDGTTWVFASNITGGTAPYSILWSTGDNAAYVTGLAAGTYSVTVTGDEGCSTTMSVTTDCDKKDDTCMFRTQTPGGWGAPPNGNNPGAYLHANFASCFPNGLIIGCDNTLELSSAQAITDFLPSGGAPKYLPAGNMVDPTNYKNVFAGHLTAATLAVTFDACDTSFSPGSITLGEAYLLSGPLQGLTVQELLDESNNSIGGCGSNYNKNALKSALAMVNENYVDGTIDEGNIGCGDEGEKSLIGSIVNTELSIYPNPATDIMTLEVMTSSAGIVEVAIMDITGRIVLPARSIAVKADMLKQISLDVSTLQNGTYLVTVLAEGSITSKIVMIAD